MLRVLLCYSAVNACILDLFNGHSLRRMREDCAVQYIGMTHVILRLQMVSKLPRMKSICNLHIDKLEFFRLVHPETAYSFPPLYREVFGSEINFPDSTNS